MDLTDQEVRVLGCLFEKHLTTPAYYPMTVNALVTACNQATSRWPVVDYDQRTVEAALEALRGRGWVRTVRVPGQRSIKHRHVLDEMLDLTVPALSLLAVLMLRGPQTAGELRARTTRYHEFGGLEEVDASLGDLAGRTEPLVERLERRPGEKEARFRHLLGGIPGDGPEPAAGDEGVAVSTGPTDLETRIVALESEVGSLRAALNTLTAAMGRRPPEG